LTGIQKIEKIAKIEVFCYEILSHVKDRIAKGERQFKIK